MDALKEAVKERLTGNVTGHFLIVWLLVNWRVPIQLIYGDASPQDRIEAIVALFPGGLENNWLTIVIGPLFFTVLYLLVVPLLRENYSKWLRITAAREKLDEVETERLVREATHFGNRLETTCTGLVSELGRTADFIFRARENFRSALNGADQSSIKSMSKDALNEMDNKVKELKAVHAALQPIFQERADLTGMEKWLTSSQGARRELLQKGKVSLFIRSWLFRPKRVIG